jgi:4-alpha-glucanotransferase
MANTHDLPTLAGWWTGRDLHNHTEAKGTEAGARTSAEWVRRSADRAALLQCLVNAALLAPDRAEQLLHLPNGAGVLHAQRELLRELVVAVHRLVCSSGSSLAVLALEDLALELEQVNRPGVPMQEWSSWSRRMALPISELSASR